MPIPLQPRDFRKITALENRNVESMILGSRESIPMLLSRPRLDIGAEQVAGIGTDVVGNIEEGENALTYDAPVQVIGMVSPNQEPPELMVDGTKAPSGSIDEAIAILIVDPFVPEKSLINYYEYINDTDLRLVSLYVKKSDAVGRMPTKVCRLMCIPFEGVQL